MESLLIYILKSAGLLSLFYILYFLLLKNDTAFTANRRFLLGGILTSAVLPAIYFTKTVIVNAPVFAFSKFSSANLVSVQETQPTDWWFITGGIYLAISAFFLLQLLFRSVLIFRTIKKNSSYKKGKYNIVETTQASGPYSFFNYIFINSKAVQKEELDLMLNHEKVHADQFHSIDMLLANLLTAALWFNPLSWFYKKSIEQNLEFIADHETAYASECIQQYQHILVKVSTNSHQPALVNHFYQSFIKKRIVMLNKKTSNPHNLSKMSIIFPLLFAFLLCFNVKTEAQVKQAVKVTLNNVQFIPEILESVIITSATTRDELEEVAREFKKHGVELQFKKLKFSKEGLLTRININYEIKKTGDSGSFNKEGNTAIDDIEISLLEDFNIEFRSPQILNENNDFVVTSDSSSVAIGSIARPKKRVWKTNLDDVTIERVMYTSPSKSTTKGTFSVGNNVSYYPTENDSINGKGKIINVRTKNGNQIKWIEKDSLTSKNGFKISDTMDVYVIDNAKNVTQTTKALFVLDGKVQHKNFNANSIDPENIAHIKVIKGTGAIEKYGKKASEGAIEITTKSNTGTTSNWKDVHMHVIHKDQNDISLENLRKMIKNDANIDAEFSNIKRNSEGIITSIKIKAETKEGKKASASFSNSEGIPMVIIGLDKNNRLIVSSNYKDN